MAKPNGRSRLLAKFGKKKTSNPYAEEEIRVVENFSTGVEEILSMHNAGELASLCGVLCLASDGTNGEKIERVLAHIARQTQIHRNPEKAYSDVLLLVWEGIIFEYLRAKGAAIKSVEHDPRVRTMQLWRNRAAEQNCRSFQPLYVPRNVQIRTKADSLDGDIRALLNGIAAKEIFMKESEKRIRRDNDYRNVVMYLAAVSDLHDYEEDCRQYLIGEIEMLRARCEHQAASLERTVLQMYDLEGKHKEMAEEWCRTLAAHESSAECYAGMLTDNFCDMHALAIQIEDFLRRYSHHVTDRLGRRCKPDILGGLVCKLFACYELDSRRALDEITATASSLANCASELSRQQKRLEFETERAVKAEKTADEWERRYRSLHEGAARSIAQLEIENQLLQSEVGSQLLESLIAIRRRDVVRTHLGRMSLSGKGSEEATMASVLEALALMSDQGIQEFDEYLFMRKEEGEQVTKAALHAAFLQRDK